jgi:outer membrane protein
MILFLKEFQNLLSEIKLPHPAYPGAAYQSLVLSNLHQIWYCQTFPKNGAGGFMEAGLSNAVKGHKRSLFTHVIFVYLAVLAASICPAAAQAPAPEILTLTEAIETALKKHPAIEIQYGQALAAEAKAGQARGGYYPHVNLGGAYTKIWPVDSQTSATTSLAGLPPGTYIPSGVSGQNDRYEQYAVTGNLSQLLFDFGKTPAQVGAQKLSAQAARLDLQNIREQVIFNVKQAYYGLLASERSRDVAEEAIGQFKKHLEYARALFIVGSKPKFDVTKAEVDLSNGQVTLIKAENGIRLARATLNNAIGLPDHPYYRVREDGPSEWAEQLFEEGVRRAFAQRPDLLAIQKQKQAAQESIKAVKRSHLPTFNGVAGATYVGTDFPLDHGWTAGVNMVFPLFTGFVTSYQVAEAQANLLVATGNERNLKQAIVLDLEQGYLGLREALERIRGSDTAIKQGKENLELANERYAAGLAIGVEVTDAIVAHAQAQLANIAARYDCRIAQARIDKAIGGTGKQELPEKRRP